jgi:chitinase
MVCYWGSWSYYRLGDGKFVPENIDPNICTHLIYGFAKLNNNSQIDVFDKRLDIKDPISGGLDGYRRFNSLREKNNELTTLIAIGGWNDGSIKYSRMAGNAAKRKVFIDSVIAFLQKYRFDGLDLDW